MRLAGSRALVDKYSRGLLAYIEDADPWSRFDEADMRERVRVSAIKKKASNRAKTKSEKKKKKKEWKKKSKTYSGRCWMDKKGEPCTRPNCRFDHPWKAQNLDTEEKKEEEEKD